MAEICGLPVSCDGPEWAGLWGVAEPACTFIKVKNVFDGKDQCDVTVAPSIIYIQSIICSRLLYGAMNRKQSVPSTGSTWICSPVFGAACWSLEKIVGLKHDATAIFYIQFVDGDHFWRFLFFGSVKTFVLSCPVLFEDYDFTMKSYSTFGLTHSYNIIYISVLGVSMHGQEQLSAEVNTYQCSLQTYEACCVVNWKLVFWAFTSAYQAASTCEYVWFFKLLKRLLWFDSVLMWK